MGDESKPLDASGAWVLRWTGRMAYRRCAGGQPEPPRLLQSLIDRDRDYQVLVDSNLDWGQDLIELHSGGNLTR